MGDTVTIIDDEPKPAPQVVVVQPKPDEKVEKVVTEKTTVTELKTS